MEFTGRFTPIRRRRFDLLSAASSAPSLQISKAAKQQHNAQKYVPSLLESLPFELLVELFSFLTVSELARVARTCKKMNQVAREEPVWRALCHRYFSCENVMLHSDFSWKAYFQEESQFSWDKDNSTMEAVVCARNSPLLHIDGNKITKAINADVVNQNLYETATSCSSKLLVGGRHCLEFQILSHDDTFKFAVGALSTSESFNFTMSSYGDGETLHPPTSTLTQCFYWSDGQFSDILGSAALTGRFNFNTDVDHAYHEGDIIGMLLDVDNKTVKFFKNYIRVATYSFANTDTSNNNNQGEEEKSELSMNVGIYMFAEGDSVSVRHAPFSHYE